MNKNIRNRRRARQSVVETLETRNLFSVDVSSGYLPIAGDPARSNDIAVNETADRAYFAVNVNGDVSYVPTWQVNEIAVFGGVGNDRIQIGVEVTAPALVYGGPGDDTLIGGWGNETLRGGGGNDVLVANGFGNVLIARHGRDTLYGGSGNDLLIARSGDSDLYGGGGSETLIGGRGNDLLVAGPGDNLLIGRVGDDTMYGGAGNDTLQAGFGNSDLYGGSGDNLIEGGQGNDYLMGGSGNDTIYGGIGNDTLIAGTGYDFLQGGSGNNVLDSTHSIASTVDGGNGSNELHIDPARDTFYVGAYDVVYDPFGRQLFFSSDGWQGPSAA